MSDGNTPTTHCVGLTNAGDSCVVSGPTGSVVLVTVLNDGRLKVDGVPPPAVACCAPAQRQRD